MRSVDSKWRIGTLCQVALVRGIVRVGLAIRRSPAPLFDWGPSPAECQPDLQPHSVRDEWPCRMVQGRGRTERARVSNHARIGKGFSTICPAVRRLTRRLEGLAYP